MRFLAIAGVLLTGTPWIAMAADARTITVSGEASKEIRVSFTVVYVVTNKTRIWCQDLNPLAGRWIDRTKSYTYAIDNASGQYKYELPLSELKTGTFCEWRPIEIRYTANPNAASRDSSTDLYRSLLSIDQADGKPVTRIDFQCKAVPSTSPPELMCLSQNAVVNLLNTVSPGQRSLIVNFTMGSR
jgi:hypothetical protein